MLCKLALLLISRLTERFVSLIHERTYHSPVRQIHQGSQVDRHTCGGHRYRNGLRR